ncbi:MAG: DsbA family protein [Tolumonas sp.]|nr:DsbA family protein [Tolumonas sp.]
MNALKLYYFFDPLCGWCYASAPALAGLAEEFPDALTLMPSGLFSEENSRDISPEWATYAWRNDQRIEQITGQQFSTAYYNHVLHGNNLRFDSGPATRAMTLIRTIDPALEHAFLNAAQQARYIQGLDTANPQVLGLVAEKIAAKKGIEIAADQFSAQIANDPQLAKTTKERITLTQQLMQRLNISGVPLLLVSINGQEFILHGADLYSGPNKLINSIQQIVSSQK